MDSISQTTIDNRATALAEYLSQIAKKYRDATIIGAGCKNRCKRLYLSQAINEILENQQPLTSSTDEYCLTLTQIDSMYQFIVELLRQDTGICIDIYNIDIDELTDLIGALLNEGDAFILGEDGSIILEE